MALVDQASVRETLAAKFSPSASSAPPPSVADLEDIDAGHLVGTKAEQLELNLTIHAAYAALPPPTPGGGGKVVAGWGGTGGQAKAGRMWTAAAVMLKELDEGRRQAAAKGKGKARAFDLSAQEVDDLSSSVSASILRVRTQQLLTLAFSTCGPVVLGHCARTGRHSARAGTQPG